MDAGFISVVEIGQYFMTKDNGEQFYAKACREYTLPRNDGSSQPKGWIQGNTKIGPVLEYTTSCLYGKHGVEIRIWSLSEDNTQSWVRISHGSNKFVMDSNNNDTEVPEDLPEEQALQLKVNDLACRSKAKAKQQREPVDLPSIIPMAVAVDGGCGHVYVLAVGAAVGVGVAGHGHGHVGVYVAVPVSGLLKLNS